jgi:hypothetical protein
MEEAEKQPPKTASEVRFGRKDSPVILLADHLASSEGVCTGISQVPPDDEKIEYFASVPGAIVGRAR